ncbi:MAG: hypothetical protein EHM58_05235 [Ignavibacteriae bacterium]|nr:MAG: hypothetical protein EHM58_05235 [Ignavibacteriota bacterium]
MSILDTEIKASELKNELKKPCSTGLKLIKISAFLSELFHHENLTPYNSYYLEFSHFIILLIKKKEFNYIAPGRINDLLKILDYCTQIPDVSLDIKAFEDASEILNKKKEEILLILGETKGKIKEETKVYAFPDKLNIVLIEPDNKSKYEQAAGEILPLNIDIKRTSNKNNSFILTNDTGVDDNGIKEQLENSVKIAEQKCLKDKIKYSNYDYIYSIGQMDACYLGKSLGIGTALLAFNAVLFNTSNKYYYKFLCNTVYTGELNDKGFMVPMPYNVLKAKLEIVFYSPFKNFVIPEDNYSDAKNLLSELNKKYPGRCLEIFPVKKFEQVLENEQCIKKYDLKLTEKIKHLQKIHSNLINIVLLFVSIIIMVFFVLTFLIPKLDKNPEYAKYENYKVGFYNKHDIKLFETDNVDPAFQNFYTNKEIFTKKVNITDIDGDGKNEILYITRTVSDPLKNRLLYCIEGNGNVKWIDTIPGQTVYYNTLHEDNFQTDGIFVTPSLNNDTRKIILTGLLNKTFPFGIFKLDHTGKILSQYWNSGQLVVNRFADIEKDGKEEFIAAYCNNHFRCAAMVIFDTDFIEGASPQTDPLRNGKPGLEKYYILFPKTIINTDYLKKLNNDVIEIQQLDTNGLEVTVSEGTYNTTDEDIFIIYKFDKDMNVKEIVFSSHFIGINDNLTNKSNTSEYYQKLSDSLKTNVRWWNGEKFVNSPIQNKYYLQANNPQR